MREEFLTIQKAAQWLGISPTTLRRWEEKGVFIPERTVGNQRRYRLSVLQAFKNPGKVDDTQAQNSVQQTTSTQYVPLTEALSSPITDNIDAQQLLKKTPTLIQNTEETPFAHAEERAALLTKAIPKETFFSKIPTRTTGLFIIGGLLLIVSLSAFSGKFSGASNSDSQTSPTGNSVLAAKSNGRSLIGDIMFNLPTIFNGKVQINNDFEVNGKSLFNEDIKVNNKNVNLGTGKVTASNVIYSLTAGANVSISGDPQNPVINANLEIPSVVTSFQGQTGAVELLSGSGISLDGLTIANTGVLSLGGQTGDVELSAGDGIEVSGTTITNNDKGSSQNIFKEFIVDAFSILATSNNDTLTFEAGSGIVLTPDTASKKITITSNASGTLSGLNTNGVLYATSSTNASSTTAGTNGTVLKGVTGGAPVFSAVSLTADVTGTLPIGNGGTGVTGTPSNGQLLIGNGSGYTLGTIVAGSGIGVSNGAGTVTVTNNGVLSLAGTANQVSVSGATGAVTLSLPQNIHTGATPTFAAMTITNNTNQLTLGTGNTGVITLASLTSGQIYTLPDASGEICLSSGNCPGGGGGTIGGSGTTNYLPKFTNATTLGSSAIYDSGGKIGIGTTSPQGLFSVSGGVAGLALVSLNETGNQDILVGSASGTTRFAFDRNGNLNLIGGGYQINGTTVLSSTTLGSSITGSSLTSVSTLTSGAIASGFGTISTANTITGTTINGTTGINTGAGGGTQRIDSTGNLVNIAGVGTNLNPTANNTYSLGAGGNQFSNIYGQTIYQNGNQVCDSSGNCVGSTNYWDQANGALSAKNTTVDLLVGGASSASAKFAVLNVNSGTPVASVSAGANGAAYLSANGILQATNNQTLTIGGNTTGNIILDSGSGLITLADATALSSSLTVGGTTTLNGAFTLGDGGDTGSINTSDWDISTTGDLSGIGSIAFDSTLTQTGAGQVTFSGNVDATSGLDVTGANFTVGGNATITTAGAITGLTGLTSSGTIRLSSYTTNNGLLYTNASGDITQQATAGTDGQILIANASGIPTWVTLGTDATISNTGSLTIANNAVRLGQDTTGDFVTRIATGSGILVSGTFGEDSVPTVSLGALTSDWNQTGAFDLVLNNANSELKILESAGATFFGTIDVPDLASDQTYTFPTTGGTICVFEAGNCTGGASASKWQLNGSVLAPLVATNQVVLGGNTATSNQFEVNGKQTGKALVSFNETGNQDIFTASASGVTKFTITNTGNLSFAGNTSFINTLTSVATQNQTYTLPDASGTICLTTGNCAGAGGGLTGSGTSGQIAFFNGSGTLTSEASGFAWDATNNKLGIGIDAPISKVDVTGSVTGKALVSLNETGGNDIFTASASGTTRLALSNSGNLNLIGGVYQSGGVSGITQGSPSCVTTTGGIVTGFGTCQLGTEQWVVNSGAIYTGIPSLDLLLGGTSTASARFAVLNIAGGTPTASVSAGTSGAAYITAAGALQTTANQTLTLGGNTTGNIVLDSGNGVIRLADLTTNGVVYTSAGNGTLNSEAVLSSVRGGTGADLSSATHGSISYFSSTGIMSALAPSTAGFVLSTNGAGQNPSWIDASLLGTNYFDRSNGAISPKIAGVHDLLLGSNATSSAKFAFINVNSGTPTASISAGTANNAAFLTGAGVLGTTNAQTLTLGGTSTGNILLDSGSGLITLADATVLTSSLTVAGATTLNGSFVFGDNGDTGAINTSDWDISATGDLSGIGSIAFDSTLTQTGTGLVTFTGNVDATNGLDVTNANFTVGGNATITTAGAITGTQLDIDNLRLDGNTLSAQSGNLLFSGATGDIATANRFTVGTSTPGNGQFNVLGAQTGKALAILNETGNQAIFTASAAGTTRFTIANNGQLTATAYTTGVAHFDSTGLITSSAVDLASADVTGTLGASNGGTGFITYNTGDLLVGNGSNTLSKLGIGGTGSILSVQSGTPTWVASSSINFWQRTNGGIAPLNITDDLLLGGSSTASARFAFINNIGSGTPTASISANSGSNAAFLTGTGNLGTTNAQTLTLGGASTGNIVIDSGSNAITLADNTTLSQNLTVAGTTGLTFSTTGGINLAGGTISDGTDEVDINDDLAVSGILQAGGASATTYSRLGTATAGGANIGASNDLLISGALEVDDLIYADGGIDTTFTQGSIVFAGANGVLAESNNTLFWDNTNSRLGLGTTSPLVRLDIRGQNATTPAASISANSNFAAAVVDQSGAGDLFTASKSGATKFVIANNGNIQFAGTSNFLNTIQTAATAARTYTLPDASGTICLQGSASCGFATGTNFWQSANAGTIAPYNDTVDLLVGGTSTASAKFAITGVAAGTPVATLAASTNNNGLSFDAANSTIQSLRNNTLSLGGNTTGNVVINPNGTVGIGGAPSSTVKLNVTGATDVISRFAATGGNAAIRLSPNTGAIWDFTAINGTANRLGFEANDVEVFSLVGNGSVGIGTTAPVAALDVRGNTGHLPVASVSGSTTAAGLLVDNTGTGALFTASKSGATKFTINNNGNLQFAGTTNFLSTIQSAATSAQTWTLPDASGTFCLQNSTSCGFATGTNYWQAASAGTISPYNNTVDVLFGGTSTASAKFAFINNVGAGTPTASISAGSNNTTFLTGAGNLGTTNAQTLTLGGASTGNIVLDSGSGLITLADAASLASSLTVAGTTTLNGIFAFGDNGDLGSINTSDWDISTTGDLSGIGSIAFDSTLTQTGAGQVTFTGNVDATSGLDVTGANFTVGGNATITTAGAITGTQLDVDNLRLDGNTVSAQSGNLLLSGATGDIATSNRVTIGTQTPGLGQLNVLGAQTGKALAIFNETGNQDILTASASGTTRLTLSNGGNLNLIGGVYQSGGVSGITQGSPSCVTTTGGIVTGFGTCQLGTEEWIVANGSIATGIPSLDLLLGGSSTASAKFAVLNMAGAGSPTASLSGTAGSTYLTAAGTLQTTNNQTLTFGGISTGNIIFSPLNGTGIITANATTLNLTGTTTLNGTSLTAINGGATAIDFAEFDVVAGTGSITIDDNANAGNITIEGTRLDIDSLDFTGAGSLNASGANTLTLQSGATGNVQFFGATNTISSTGNLSLAGTTHTFGNGSAATIQTSGNANLTLAAAGSGNLLFSTDADSSVGIGTTSPLATLDVRAGSGTVTAASISGQTARAALIVDNSGVGDLFAASKSGATKFTIANNGNIQFAGTSNFLNTIQTAATAARTYTLPDASGTLCIQNSSSCGFATGTNFWQSVNAGTIAPYNNTVDLLVGGTATNSAKFAITGVAAGTPVATLAATTNNNGLVFDAANASIQSLRNNTLTIGGNTTGNILLDSGSNVLQLADNTIQLTGSAPVISATTTNAAVQLNANGNGTLTLNSGTTGNIQFFGATNTISSTGNLSLAGTSHTFGNGSAATLQTSGNANLTLAAAGSGNLLFSTDSDSSVGIGTTSPLATLDVRAATGTTTAASVSGQTAKAALVVDNSGIGDIFTASSSGLSRFTIKQSGIAIAGSAPFSGYSNVLSAGTAKFLVVDPTDARMAAVVNNAGIFYRTDGNSAGFYGYDYTNSRPLYLAINEFGGGVIIGAQNTTPASSFDLRGSNGTLSIASISGSTTFAGLTVDNNGSGDIFTASKSGATKLTLTNAGNLNLAAGNVYQVGGVAGITQATPSCVTTTGGIVTGTAECEFGVDTWTGYTTTGVVASSNSTMDVLIGGVATSAAKFAITGVAAGTPVATLAASTNNNGLSLNAATATIQSVRNNTLTLGGNTTGNIVIDSGSNVLQLADNTLQLTGSAPIIGATTTNAAVQLNANGNGTLTLNSGGTGNIQFFGATNTISSTGNLTLAGTSHTLGNGSAATIQTSGNSNLTLAAAGSGHLLFSTDSDSSVGIGTTSPLATLDVRAGTGTTTAASVSGQTAKAAFIIDNSGRGDLFTASSSGLSRFVIRQNGDIGVGTTLPTTRLEVANTSSVGTGFRVSGTTATNHMTMYIDGSNNTRFDSTSNLLMNFANGSGLTVGGPTAFGGVQSGITVWGSATFSRNSNSTTAFQINDNAANTLFNADTTNLRIGIGTSVTSPLSTLDVRATSATTAVASVSGSTNHAALVVDNSGNGDILTASAGGATRFVIGNNGKVTSTSYSTSGFIIQNASSSALLSADTISSILTTSNIEVGSQSASTTGHQFSDSFEEYSQYQYSAAWSIGGTSSPSMDTNTVHTGAYSVRNSVNNGQSYVNKAFTGTASEVLRAYVYVPSAQTAMSTYTEFASLTNAANVYSICRDNSTGKIGWANSSATCTTTGSTVYMSPDAWHKVELVVTISATVGTANVYIDDALAMTQTGLNTGTGTVDGINIGNTRTTQKAVYYLDDVTVDTVRATGNSSNVYVADDLHVGGAADIWGPLYLNNGTTTGMYFDPAGRIYSNSSLSLYGTSIRLAPDGATKVIIGANTTPGATLDIRAASGTQAIASTGGSTSYAALVANNSGNGDLFTASSSGLNRFVIKQNGNVNIGTQSALIAPYKLYVSDYKPATAAAMIENTAANNSAVCPANPVITSRGCKTGLLVKLGTPDNATMPGVNDIFIGFLAGNGRRVGEIRGTGGNNPGVAYSTNGADYAEYFPVNPSVLPANYTDEDKARIFSKGILICQSENGVIPCTSPSDPRILGIISESPGFAGGEDGPNKVLVGVLGQLPVKVSSKNGTIKQSDLLASSGIPGVAVKATKAGEVIGRALANYDNTDPNAVGEVMTYVSRTWYDPRANLNDDGNITIDGKPLSTESLQTAFNDVKAHTTDTVAQLEAAVEEKIKALTQKTDALTDRVASAEAKLAALDGVITLGSSDEGLSFETKVATSAAVADLKTSDASQTGQLASLFSQIASLGERLSFLEGNASTSALIASTPSAFTASSGAELGLDTLDVREATVSDKLTVLGRTLLSDLGITDKITAGLLSITGLDDDGTASINTSAGPLKLQSTGINGLDILNGKFTVSASGNIKTEGTITTKKINIDTSAVAGASLGEGILKAGTSSVIIDTTAVTNKSAVFVTPKTKTSLPLSVTTQVPGDSFKVETNAVSPIDIKFSWWIVN